MTKRTSNDVQSFARSIFGKDLPIVDAKSDLILQPIKLDCEGADPRTPNNCVLSKCAQRMYGAKVAVFWRYYALIDLVNSKNGRREINRYVNTAAARRHIYDLDGGEPFREGTSIRLRAPTGSHQLVHRRRNAKAFHATPKGKLTAKLQTARRVKRKTDGDQQRATELLNELKQTEKPQSPKMLAAIQRKESADKAARIATETLKFVTEKLDEVRKASGTDRPRRAHTFDLTSRNGAAGNYNWKRNGDATVA